MVAEHDKDYGKFVEELLKQIKKKMQNAQESLTLNDVLSVFESKEQVEQCMDLSDKILELLSGHKGYIGIIAISMSCANYYIAQDSMPGTPEHFGSAIGRVISLLTREFLKDKEPEAAAVTLTSMMH